jgi:GNAT superfamily N-acetyltransferase
VAVDFRIREATVDDLPVLLHHRRAMFEEMGFTEPESLGAAVRLSEPFMRQGLVEGFYRAWLAQSDGKVAAGAGLLVVPWIASPRNPVPSLANVLNVYTEPVYRRRGLSRRLMEGIIEWCREQGFGVMHLHASEVGRFLYESLGFEPSNEMRLSLQTAPEQAQNGGSGAHHG